MSCPALLRHLQDGWTKQENNWLLQSQVFQSEGKRQQTSPWIFLFFVIIVTFYMALLLTCFSQQPACDIDAAMMYTNDWILNSHDIMMGRLFSFGPWSCVTSAAASTRIQIGILGRPQHPWPMNLSIQTTTKHHCPALRQPKLARFLIFSTLMALAVSSTVRLDSHYLRSASKPGRMGEARRRSTPWMPSWAMVR